jgi:hypothetical protein
MIDAMYLEKAVRLEHEAAKVKLPNLKAVLLKQAEIYRKLANRSAEKIGRRSTSFGLSRRGAVTSVTFFPCPPWRSKVFVTVTFDLMPSSIETHGRSLRLRAPNRVGQPNHLPIAQGQQQSQNHRVERPSWRSSL